MRGRDRVADRPADVITMSNPVVDDALLDAAAARAFRQAAVRLAGERPQTDGAWQAAREAAEALVSLAMSEDETALRRYLRPDPRSVEVAWTVACYQIGDLTPCALLDFANPVAAVTTLAGCGEASHVAAELVASTPSGIRWTAMTRTGRAVTFQLPDGRSASGATRGRNGELREAGQQWRERLGQWAMADEPDQPGWPEGDAADAQYPADADGDADAGAGDGAAWDALDAGWTVPAPRPAAIAPRPAAIARAPEMAPAPFVDRAPPAIAAPAPPALNPAPASFLAPAPVLSTAPAPPGPDLERALELVIKAMRNMDARIRQPNTAPDEIVVRLDVLDRRLSDFQASVERALDDRMETLANEAAEQRAVISRLDARLDDLIARLPARPGARPLDTKDFTA